MLRSSVITSSIIFPRSSQSKWPFQVHLQANRQLRNLGIIGLPQAVSRIRQSLQFISHTASINKNHTYLQISRIRDALHSLQESPRHSTLAHAANISIRARLIIPTAREHSHHLMLPLILSIVAILSQTGGLRFPHVLEGTEEVRSTGVQILRLAELLEGETAGEEIVGFAEELHTDFQVIQEVYVPLVIGTVDERELEGGSGVAAIEDHEEGTAWWKSGHQVFMEDITVDLSIFLEVYRADGVENTGRMVPSRITDLASVSGIVEEVAGSRFTGKPVDCRLCLLARN